MQLYKAGNLYVVSKSENVTTHIKNWQKNGCIAAKLPFLKSLKTTPYQGIET